MLKKTLTILGLSVSLLIVSSHANAHTSRLTLDQTNELYTRLAAEGRGVDTDQKYGMQCVDIDTDLTNNYVGVPISGNAIDLLDSARAAGYEIVPASKLPRAGDLFVMDTNALYGHGYGHTGYIYKVNSDGSFETVEQNVGDDSNLYTGTVAKFMHRTRDYMLGYIRLAYRK